MNRLAGKTAVVTGAARGLGEAIAELFAGEGARLVLGDIDAGALEAMAQRIASNHDDVIAVPVDVASDREARLLIESAIDRYGTLEVLVNNAGIASAGTVTEVEEEEWDRVMAVNVKGAYLCSRHAIPHMAHVGSGSIVCVSSASGVIGQKGQVAYNVSKHGVIGLVRCMALDHAEAGIRVNAVCPGVIQTPMVDSLEEEQLVALREMHPLGRIAQPHEIAQAVLHLASDESSFTTGAAFMVDGGLTAM